MMTVTVIILMAAVLVPELKDDRQVRVIAASRLLGSDLEMAQVMNITNPQQPIVVRFEPAIGKYWLATAGAPDTPIKRPGTEKDYVVHFGYGEAAGAEAVTMQLAIIQNNKLAFNAHGGIDAMTASPSIKLVYGSRWIKLTISPITGAITESSGS